MASLVITDKDKVHEQANSNDLVILSIDVKSSPVEDVVKTLEKLASLPKERRPGVVCVVFSGWCDDDRELFEIPEVVSWANDLVECYPYCLKAVTDERSWHPGLFPGVGRAKLFAIGGHAKIEKHPGGKHSMELDDYAMLTLDSLEDNNGLN